MSVVSLGPQNFDYLSLETHPSRSFHFLSSSNTGFHNSGSIYVYVDRSKRIKDTDYVVKDILPSIPFGKEEKHNILTVLNELETVKVDPATGQPIIGPAYENLNQLTDTYLKIVGKLGVSERKQQLKTVAVDFPKSTFSSQSLAKNLYRKILYKDYKSQYQTLNWAYTNYNCLNFFTGTISLGNPGQLNESISGNGRFPENSALIYPAHTSSTSTKAGGKLVFPRYRPSRSFTFSFWINPRYNSVTTAPASPHLGGFWHAATIMHMSSCYAISMVTSSYSKRGLDGNPDRFRVMLQLSHSAGIEPSKINTDTWQNSTNPVTHSDGLVFLSDGELKYNNWHHVAITWGSRTTGGDGNLRFFIDGVEDTVSSCAIDGECMPTTEDVSVNSEGYLNSDALFIGNYYNNTTPATSTTQQALFFNNYIKDNEGTLALRPGDNVDPANAASKLTHPLKAEIHEIRIYGKEYPQDYIQKSIMPRGILPHIFGAAAPLSHASPLLFYLPPYFRKQVPRTRYTKVSPFQSSQDFNKKFTTIDPFNIDLSQRTNVREINLQNFLQDFSTFETPRCFMLTGALNTTVDNFADGEGFSTVELTGQPLFPLLGKSSGEDNHMAALKGNLTILPCDNGLFRPDWSILAFQRPATAKAWPRDLPFQDIIDGGVRGVKHINIESGSAFDKYVSDQNILDLSLINISNVDSISDTQQLFLEFVKDQHGNDVDIEPIYANTFTSPTRPKVVVHDKEANGEGLPRYMTWHLQDNSSNLVTWFNISNLYYGDRIKRESFTLKARIGKTKTGRNDPFCDSLPITLKDNGHGSLYRADSYTPHAKWNNVGDLLYEEGFAIIKSPHIFDIGRVSFDVDFQGDRKVHVLEIMVPCEAGHFVSSSNESFQELLPSDHVNDQDSNFVYISSINLHDDNFNVLMRSNLAQPVVKRHEDKLFFRIKVDF